MATEPGFSYELDRVLAVRPQPGQIQARYYRGLSNYLLQRGENPRNVLEKAGIDPLSLSDPDSHLSCADMANLVEYSGRRLDDQLFGFHLAEHQDANAFGTVSVLAHAARNFRQAVQVLIDYLPTMHSPEGVVWLVETEQTAEIRWSGCSDLSIPEQANYHGCAVMLRAFKALAGHDFAIRHLGMPWDPSPGIKAMLQDALGCGIQWSEENFVRFDRDVLDRPISTANAMLFDFLGSYLALAKEQTKPELKTVVEEYVRRALPSGRCTIDRCAAKLGLSVRALQKQMTEAGLSFWTIVESQRFEIAKRALLDGNDNLDNIAYSLGYSDQTCFGRAFKRWTGTTPRVFRNRSLS